MLARMNSVLVVALAIVAVLVGTSGVARAIGLAGYWPLDDSATATYAVDASGNGNNAVPYGGSGTTPPTPHAAAGAIGYAWQFNTTNEGSTGASYLLAPNTNGALAGFGSNMSISEWVYTASADSSINSNLLITVRNSNTDGSACKYDMRMSNSTGSNLTLIVNNVGSGASGSATAIPTNEWVFQTCTYNGSHINGYVMYNGYTATQPAFSSSQSLGSIAADTSPVFIGGTLLGANAYCLKGLEDDIAIWNNTLTDGQAKALYNTPVLFGLGVNNQYGAGTMNSLFTLYGQGASGTPVPVGSLTWQYMAPGTTGHNAGDAWTVGGNYYVQLGTDGSGVEATTIPEPGTLILLAAGLIGLLCYAWRKRR